MQRRLRWALVTMALAINAVCVPAIAADSYMDEAIKKPAYARALKNLLDHAGVPDWAREVLKPKGYIVETPATYATIDGVTYQIFVDCMPHNCDVARLAIMFAPGGTQAWGALVDESSLSYLGTPSEAQAAVLEKALRPRSQPENH